MSIEVEEVRHESPRKVDIEALVSKIKNKKVIKGPLIVWSDDNRRIIMSTNGSLLYERVDGNDAMNNTRWVVDEDPFDGLEAALQSLVLKFMVGK